MIRVSVKKVIQLSDRDRLIKFLVVNLRSAGSFLDEAAGIVKFKRRKAAAIRSLTMKEISCPC